MLTPQKTTCPRCKAGPNENCKKRDLYNPHYARTKISNNVVHRFVDGESITNLASEVGASVEDVEQAVRDRIESLNDRCCYH